ncbi:unnamed protein product [Orchesella dallaii]|uniref:Integrator complex subunit 14 n=1 Tax=Orchesella dallaii TaxID=48710 RepID=A0ABP1QDR8_9HEXA
MPTIIVADASLSMLRPVGSNYGPEVSDDDIPTRKTLTVEVINQFVDHVSAHCKLEFVALMTFSSAAVVERTFTRDLYLIRESVLAIPTHDVTNYDALLSGIAKLVADSWGTTVPIQILLVTDGSLGFGSGSLRDVARSSKKFPFPAKMNVLSLNDPEDKNFAESCQMLKKLIEVTCEDGCIYLPENHLNSKECSTLVEKICAKDYTPYKGTIKCGHMSSKVTLCPPPQPFVSKGDEKRYDISEQIEVLGFILVNDMASPPVHSRHLLLPLKSSDGKSNGKGDEGEDSDGNVPNFCVLLHGALKVSTEHYCAMCEVGTEWFGFIHAFSDSKKKSNLILSILSPGTNIIPWLGNLQHLGPKEDFIQKKTVQGDSAPVPSFPVKHGDKKSYIATPNQTTVWLTPGGLNADIQKLLRHARKLPEKTQQFYKELNRMRRWALALGFDSVLETIAAVLERECISTSHPEASIQLTYAATQLRTQTVYSHTITQHSAK